MQSIHSYYSKVLKNWLGPDCMKPSCSCCLFINWSLYWPLPQLSFPLLSFNHHTINAWSFFPLVHTLLSCSGSDNVTACPVLWEPPGTAWKKRWVNFSKFFHRNHDVWEPPALSFDVVTDVNCPSKWVRVRMRKRSAGEMKKKMRRSRRRFSLLSVPINGNLGCHTMDCRLTVPLIHSRMH